MGLVGIKFPFQKGSTQFPAQSRDEVVVAENILRILQERKGERVMRSDTGSSVWDFIFENTGPVLQARVDFEVRRAIGRGEPRATVLQVLTREEKKNSGDVVIFVDILYEYNQKANVVTSAYTNPAPVGG